MSEQQQQNQQAPNLTEEERQLWVREQFQSANKYLAERGLLSDQILTKESRYLVPDIAVWKFKLQNGKKVWVINGRVTTDHVNADVAKSPRDVMRHFSLQWQLKAENIRALGDAADPAQRGMVQILIRNAEALYQLSQEEQLWVGDASA